METPIPTAVRKADERARAKHAQMKEQPPPAQTPKPAAAPQSAAQPPAATPQQTQPASVQPLTPATPQKGEDPAYWQTRANTLAGMIQAKDGEIQQLKATHTQQTQALQNQLNQLSQRLTDAESAKQKASNDQHLQAFASEYDENDPLRQVIENQAGTIAALQQQLVDLKGQSAELGNRLEGVQGTQVHSLQEQFWAKIGGIKDRELIERDRNFVQWMNEPDPNARRYGKSPQITRQALLEEALNRFDAESVVSYYDEWRRQAQPQGSSPQPSEVHHENPGGQPQVGESATGRQWRESEVRKFYEDWRKGRYNDEQAVALEKDIQAAVQQGRYIRGS